MAALLIDQGHIENGNIRQRHQRQLASHPFIIDGANSGGFSVRSFKLQLFQVESGLGIGTGLQVAKFNEYSVAAAWTGNHLNRASLVGGDRDANLLNTMYAKVSILLEMNGARIGIERRNHSVVTSSPLDGVPRRQVLRELVETEKSLRQARHGEATTRKLSERCLGPALASAPPAIGHYRCPNDTRIFPSALPRKAEWLCL